MIEDFSKFKRFFAFGCSYTNYIWPTWANIIDNEIEGEYYNLGRTGSGNLFISCRIAEANRRYNFCETDLVAVMFTSLTREDRYVEGEWKGQGNIYNQSYYPADFVKQFAEPDFYLIRDMALMDTTCAYLKSLPCESLLLSAWPFNLLENNQSRDGFTTDVMTGCKEIYKELTDQFPVSLRDFVDTKIPANSGDFHKAGFIYEKDGRVFRDGHPNTMTYYEYLQHIKLPLTDKSKKYTNQSYQKLLTCKTEYDMMRLFPECTDHLPMNNKHGLF